jgi:hypothetical protein
MIVEYLDVDIDVTLDSNVDLEPLLADFLKKMKQQLVPALAECFQKTIVEVFGGSDSWKQIIQNMALQIHMFKSNTSLKHRVAGQ